MTGLYIILSSLAIIAASWVFVKLTGKKNGKNRYHSNSSINDHCSSDGHGNSYSSNNSGGGDE